MRNLLCRIAAIWALIGGILLLAIVAVTSWNIGASAAHRIARLVHGTVGGLPGYEDFVSLVTGSAVLMFFPYCQARSGHVRVDLFISGMRPAWRRALDRIWLAVMAVTAAFLCVMMLQGMFETRADQALSRVLGWQVWPFYLPGVLSLALWAVVAAQQIRHPEQAEAGRDGRA